MATMKKGFEIYEENGRRIVRGLGFYEPKPVLDLRQLVKDAVSAYGAKVAFKYKGKKGEIIEKNYLDLDRDVDSLGTALIARGLKNSRISIISENRYDWAVSFFAIINGTGIGVPLDKYLPLNEVENLVNRGGVEAIFYSATYQDMMVALSKTNNSIKYFICMDESHYDDVRFITLEKLKEEGEALLEKGNKAFVNADLDITAMSILLFTSGTTNMSKGVMLSHHNVASNVTGVTSILKVMPTDVHLSLLPLHHTFENTVGLVFMVHMGICIAYCEGIKHIAQNIKEYGVSILVAVPAIFEAIYNRMQDAINKSGKRKAIDLITKVSNFLFKAGIDVRRKLFKPVLNNLGPNLRIFVSGAAPMNPEIIKGFYNMGIPFVEGYGLTESAPVIAATNEYMNAHGTIGYPILGVEVTLADQDENGMGEILARGENIMLGYFEAPELTEEVIEKDGWLRTGDLGVIDNRGIIRITGRAKSMIVFTNGKKAFPEEYEVLLNALPGVKESFVWGNKAPDGDIQVCAKLVIDDDYFKEKHMTTTEIGDMLDKEIRSINKTLPQYKIIRYFLLSGKELIKTTKMTIRRPLELESIKRYLEIKGMDIRRLSKSRIDDEE